MTPGPERASASPLALAAARTVLDTHRLRVTGDAVLIETSAWLVAAEGEAVPTLRGAQDELHARLAGAAGRGNIDDLVAVLHGHLPQEAGRDLLLSACRLAGGQWADELVQVAAAHPGRRLDGRWLVGTAEPDALLALLPWRGTGPPDGLTASTVGELMISGYDRGVIYVPAQRLWDAVSAAPSEHLAAYRDPALRLAARRSLAAGVTLLRAWEERFGRQWITEGAHAVIARLAQIDPDHALRVVTASADPVDRVEWLRGLAWSLELVPAALPLVRVLLDMDDPEIDIDLVEILAGTSEPELLARAVTGASAGYSVLTVATTLAAGVRRWSCGLAGSPGLAETAAGVRAQCRGFLPNDRLADDVLAATDVFDVLSVAQPWRYPWDPAPPGLP